MSVSISADVGW